LHWVNAALLVGAAVFDYPGRGYVLFGLLLFLPLLDRRWSPPALPRSRKNYLAWAGLIVAAVALLVWQPRHADFALMTLLTAALPEEWFFRAYFMMQLGMGWHANLVSSLLFSLVHGLTWGWMTALLVFVPSLFYGWLYQKTRDLVLLVGVHALSNLVYVMFLRQYLTVISGTG
jgi:membrane protease YdiL (CAAX protease family)